MIENITKNLSKVELMSYLNYGSNPYYKNSQNSKGQNQNKEQENPGEIRFKQGTNPFDTFEKSLDDKIQAYFNKKYFSINSKVREIISKLSKKGSLRTKIDESVIESSSVIARYLYNSTLPEEKDYIYNIENNILQKKDLEDNLLMEVKFSGSNISLITLFENDSKSLIYFRKQGLMESLLRTDLNKLQKYEKRDSKNNLIEDVEFVKNGAVQKYSSYENNKLDSTLQFDLNCPSDNFLNPTTLFPLEFTEFEPENEERVASLSYLYSRPSKYCEYNPKTRKPIKVFALQGLHNLVSKYVFYDANGIMTQSGNL